MDSRKQKASDIIDHLRGTLIADLKRVMHCATTSKIKKYYGHGGLNYTVFLLSLIACETIGFYVYGAEHSDEDPGTYIIKFLEEYFPQGNNFKKIDKILADYLRHSLVHGFGHIEDSYPFDLDISVGKVKGIDEPKKHNKNNKKIIKLSGYSFAKLVIEAFEKIAYEIKQNTGKTEALIDKILTAQKHVNDRQPSSDVMAKFDNVYESLPEYIKPNTVSGKSSILEKIKRIF
jgi:hypothetical protein